MHFAPHPDDEGLVGALAFRLLRDAGMKIINVPVTFGSNVARRSERAKELAGACNYLGFEIYELQDGGFSDISPAGKTANPANWDAAVGSIATAIEEAQPAIILVPHRQEFNSTHQGTNEAVIDALERQDLSYEPYFVEWEYWTPLEEPNLLFELSRDELATLIAAVSFHAGEVIRNPQHVNMPAWMQDNVRRGAELVGAPGDVAPSFEFATIYRVRRWRDGVLDDCLDGGRFLGTGDDVREIFPGVFTQDDQARN